MPLDLPKLTADLKASKPVIEAGLSGVEDKGSCNFDTVLLSFERLPAPALRELVLEAVKEAGFTGFWTNSRFSKGLLIDPCVDGMAGRRSRGMQLLQEFLRKAGWNVEANYMTD